MIKVKPHSYVQQLIVSDLVVCGASYHMSPPTNKLDLIQVAVPHTHVVFLLYIDH